MKILLQLFAAVGVALGIGANAQPGATAKPTVDFEKDIRPLFESRCYECHGPKKQKSGLRLDRKSSALKGGDSGKSVLLVGKSAESALIQRVTTTDPDELMPPKGEKLTSSQIDLLKKWIDQGAPWPDEKIEVKH